MSLQSLARLRVQGGAPKAIWVVVGNCPESIRDLPDTIAVTEKPAAMDWRPVVGLHVDVLDLSKDQSLLFQTIEAIEQASPKALGVACDLDVVGLSDQHEFTLKAIWRHLANHS
jgi:hypothetical protein